MGDVIDLKEVRERKKAEDQKCLLEAYESFSDAISRLHAKCPLVDVSQSVHPMVKRIHDLLGELLVAKKKVEIRLVKDEALGKGSH